MKPEERCECGHPRQWHHPPFIMDIAECWADDGLDERGLRKDCPCRKYVPAAGPKEEK